MVILYIAIFVTIVAAVSALVLYKLSSTEKAPPKEEAPANVPDIYDNADILDDICMPSLRGMWRDEAKSENSYTLNFVENRLTVMRGGNVEFSGAVHAVRYKESPSHIYIKDSSSPGGTLGPFGDLEFHGDILTTAIDTADGLASRLTFYKD